jgi:hypothetical protein
MGTCAHVTEADNPFDVVDRDPELFLAADFYDHVFAVAVQEGFRGRDIEGVEEFSHKILTGQEV